MQVSRQHVDIRAFNEDESLLLDPKMDYTGVAGLSLEVVEKLCKVKPTTIVSIVHFLDNIKLILGVI